VVEGPPEDIVIHAQRWRKNADLLRSYTGEALDAFGLSIDAAFVEAVAKPAATRVPRAAAKRRTRAKSRRS